LRNELVVAKLQRLKCLWAGDDDECGRIGCQYAYWC